jgi:hypothetical protein
MTDSEHSRQHFGKVWPWRAISLLLVVLLFVTGSAVGAGQAPPAQDPESNAATGEAAQPADGNPKLEWSLNQLLLAYERGGQQGAAAFSEASSIELEDGLVAVTVRAGTDAMGRLAGEVSTLGGKVQSQYEGRMVAHVPIDALESLAASPEVELITEPRRPILLDTDLVGQYTSEGVAASNASVWHAAGRKGAGVRIAVIDAGFDGYASLLGTDLPATVKTYDWTGSGMGGSPHGTACAEIVYDMAPQSTLYLHKVNFATHLGQAVDQAIADGVDVISMSLGWTIDGPGDGTGYLANIVKKARQNGITFVTAAGNEADETWHGTYQDDGSGRHGWPSGDWVNEYTAFISAGQVIRAGLHWDDWSGTGQDYDLELYRWTGSGWSFVSASRNRQSTGYPTPEEWIGLYAPTNGRYGLVVKRYSASRNVCFRVLVPKMGALEDYSTRRSLTFPADSSNAVTGAALDVNSPYPLESYSSHGPTFGPGGVCSGGSVKPDVGGYANVSTVSYGPNRFNGTSSGTPHVAGAAALVQGANPTFTPAQVQSFLEQRAQDQGPAGKDVEYGAGRLWLGVPPGGTNTPPTISGLPDQTLPMNASKPQAIDLWQYTQDAESADSLLAYTISNSPAAGAGVSIQSNRYVSIQPASGWTGQTDVTIRVTDPGSLSDTDTFRVTVTPGGKIWDGSSSADWHTASNWTPSGVPTSADDVTIPDTARDPVISSSDGAAKNLTVNRGAVLDLTNRKLTVEGTLANDGTLKQTQTVMGGNKSAFLRITNLAGNQTKYYGAEVTPGNTVGTAMADRPMLAVASASAGLESAPTSTLDQQTLTSTADASVLQGYPDENFGGVWIVPGLDEPLGMMWTGYDVYLEPNAGIARSLVKFNVSGLPSGVEVTKATLRVYLNVSYDAPGNFHTVTAYRATSGWTESGVTWNTKPAFAEAYGSKSIPHAAWGEHDIDVTGLVKGWIDGSFANHGIMLRGEESSTTWRAFATREEATPPLLVVDYSAPSNAPPTLGGLPDQVVPKNGSASKAIDLRLYASDAEDSGTELSFSIINSPDPNAGVTISSNRYIDIAPTSGWTGSTDVQVQVRDTGNLTDVDEFRVFVTDGSTSIVTVAIAGNQTCTGRASGVNRCYDIESLTPMEATVRFYFSEAERRGLTLSALNAYHYAGSWQEEAGPYSRGSVDSSKGLYVEVKNVNDFSPFALDTQTTGEIQIYLPIISRQKPVVPSKPVLEPIGNGDGDGDYTVAWRGSIGASTYTLHEDDNTFFGSPAIRYAGSDTSWNASGMGAGTYYYRVKATSAYGSSAWSNVQSVKVQNQPAQTRVFPTGDAAVFQGAPEVNSGSKADMWAGYGLAACGSPVDYQISRSLLKFNLSSIPAGTNILSARLNLRTWLVCYRDPTSTPRSVTVYRATDDWSESSVTWNNQPIVGEAYGSASIPFEAGAWHAFDVTGLVRSWVDGSLPNQGMMVRGPEDSTGSMLGWIGFFTRESTSGPYLEVRHTGLAASESGAGGLAPQGTPATPLFLVPGCGAAGAPGDVKTTCAIDSL